MDDPPGARTLSGTRGSRASADDRDALIPDGLNATLVLLRHGESTAIVERRFQGQLDTPLSPTGLRQASLAAARLARPRATPALPVPAGPPVEIVHSPLARTAQTATLVAAAAAGSDGFGRDIPLPLTSARMNYFSAPYIEADGRPLDGAGWRVSFEAASP